MDGDHRCFPACDTPVSFRFPAVSRLLDLDRPRRAGDAAALFLDVLDLDLERLAATAGFSFRPWDRPRRCTGGESTAGECASYRPAPAFGFDLLGCCLDILCLVYYELFVFLCG